VFKQILVAYDGSGCSEQALDQGIELAHLTGASLTAWRKWCTAAHCSTPSHRQCKSRERAHGCEGVGGAPHTAARPELEPFCRKEEELA
jgi:hypothetical protein